MERLTFAVSGGKVEGRTLSGTAHVYGTVTVDGRNHSFAPGALTKSIADGRVMSFAHHDMSKPLTSQKSGGLRLTDGPALNFELDLPDGVSYAEDLRAYVAAGGDLGMSVAIKPGKSVTKAGIKTWTSADLLSVDPVVMPAFEGTSVVLNSQQDGESAISITTKIRARVRAGRR